MNIFKKQNPEDKKQDAQKENAPDNKKQQDAQKPDRHATGGCCGSCGGHKES